MELVYVIVLLLIIYIYMNSRVDRLTREVDYVRGNLQRTSITSLTQKETTPISELIQYSPIRIGRNPRDSFEVGAVRLSGTRVASDILPVKYDRIGNHLDQQGWVHNGIVYSTDSNADAVYNLYRRNFHNDFEYMIVDERSVPIRLKNVEGTGKLGELRNGDTINSVIGKESKGPFKVEIYDSFVKYI
jgi:hypothetical protein